MMRYRFVPEAPDYSDLASGSVLHGAPGRPAFPVRLASELFQRAYSLWPGGAESRPCVLYDPCCGAGYLLAVVTLLHGEAIRAIAGSDVEGEVLRVAARNLDLLTPAGMRERIDVLADHVRRFGKESHRAATASAERLLRLLEDRSRSEPPIRLFRADALEPAEIATGLDGTAVDIVLTDTPYGATTRWAVPSPEEAGTTVGRMLSSLREVLAPGAVVVTVLPRGVRPDAPGYHRVQRFRAGRREGLFWQVE